TETKNVDNMSAHLRIDNSEIEIIPAIKYLGFQVDDCLSFQHLTINTKITVYYAIVQPHFNYCASVYSFNIGQINTPESKCEDHIGGEAPNTYLFYVRNAWMDWSL
ncbi:hypothetical protein HHI36_005804, partial [Cryptolaemus montrouzieri]